MNNQQVYEIRWSHTEAQKLFEKKNNVNYIDLSNVIKEKEMTDVLNKWDLSADMKLRANSQRPIPELIRIFKNRFTEEQIRTKLAELSQTPRTSWAKKPTLTSDEVRIIYDHREKPVSKLLKMYPELLKKVSDKTIAWYVSCIRAEIKGIQTTLPNSIYDLIREWYNSTHAVQMPLRGTVGVRNAVKRTAGKKSNKMKVVRTKKNSNPSLAVKVQEISSTVNSNVNSVLEEKVDDKFNPESVGFSTNAELRFGLLVGKDLKLIGESLAYIDGAEFVYRQLGFTDMKKVKLLMEEFV